jgi:hypothetical protein
MNNFLDNFRNWYLTNSTEITWFIIGICTLSGFESLAREQYSSALINFGLAYLNYALNRK